MNKEYNAALQQRVRDYMDERKIGQQELARRIGKSGAVVSCYLNSNYKGDVAAVERILEEFLGQEVEAVQARQQVEPYKLDNTYKPTSISEDVYQCIRYAQINRKLVVLHGDAGVGKTKAAVKYYQDNPQSTIYIKLHPSTASLGGVGELLCAALDLPTASSAKMWAAIRAKLRGTNKVIVVDEAQLLKRTPLDELRILPDEDEVTGLPGNGVVLIGNSELYERVRKGKVTSQTFTRFAMQRAYSTMRLTGDDIAMLFPLFAADDKKSELKLLAGICRSQHSIRTARNIVENAIANGDVSLDGLRAAAYSTPVGHM